MCYRLGGFCEVEGRVVVCIWWAVGVFDGLWVYFVGCGVYLMGCGVGMYGVDEDKCSLGFLKYTFTHLVHALCLTRRTRVGKTTL